MLYGNNMKNYIKLFLCALVFSVVFCYCSNDDDKEQAEISNCTLIIPSGTTFTLYSPKYDSLQVIEIDENKSLIGVKTKYLKSGIISYSFSGLDLNFESYVTLNRIDLVHKEYQMTWLHSSDANCSFWGQSYVMQLDEDESIKNVIFEAGKKVDYLFGKSTDNYGINIVGTFIIE